MNWKSIELLDPDDVGKPLLIKSETDMGVTEHFVAKVNEEGDIYAVAGEAYTSYRCNVSDVYCPAMWFVRINEIL